MKRFPRSEVRLWVRGGARLALALALVLSATLSTSYAQQSAKLYRIGFLAVNPPSPSDRTAQGCPANGSLHWQALVQGLREYGYAQGQNLVIECRATEGREERALPLATELVSLKVDLLVVSGSANVRAAKQATNTIPIVMVGVFDPVGNGLVASLARPDGNVTGPTMDAGREMAGKYLQVLCEVVPRVSRVAVLGYGLDLTQTLMGSELAAAARARSVALQFYPVRESKNLDDAFAAMSKARAEALVVLPHPFMWTHTQRIVDLATRSRLPAMYPYRDPVKAAGGLLAYGVDELAYWRRIGYYVDRIFKGTRPADLPVERPTRFALIINLKTAKALGLTIPQSLLTTADEVIQ